MCQPCMRYKAPAHFLQALRPQEVFAARTTVHTAIKGDFHAWGVFPELGDHTQCFARRPACS